MKMNKLLIARCSDSALWYAKHVGQTVDLVREEQDCYISREPSGLLNIVRKADAEVIEDKERTCRK